MPFLVPVLKGGETVVESLEVQLERVQKAIAAIEGGAQEYQIDNRRVSHADLAALYRREGGLKLALARENGEGVLYANTGRL